MEPHRAYEDRYLKTLQQASLTQGLAIALAIGSVALIAGGLLLFDYAWSTEVLLAGGVVGVLSVVAFIYAASTRRLLVAMIEAVRTDWKLHEAVRLAESMTDPQVRTRLLTALAFQLSGAAPTQNMLREIIVQREAAAPAAEPAPMPTYYQWRAHFRRRGCGRRRGRRLVLERDYF